MTGLMLSAAVFIPMPKRPMPSRLPKFIEPPNAVAIFNTFGDMP